MIEEALLKILLREKVITNEEYSKALQYLLIEAKERSINETKDVKSSNKSSIEDINKPELVFVTKVHLEEQLDFGIYKYNHKK